MWLQHQMFDQVEAPLAYESKVGINLSNQSNHIVWWTPYGAIEFWTWFWARHVMSLPLNPRLGSRFNTSWDHTYIMWDLESGRCGRFLGNRWLQGGLLNLKLDWFDQIIVKSQYDFHLTNMYRQKIISKQIQINKKNKTIPLGTKTESIWYIILVQDASTAATCGTSDPSVWAWHRLMVRLCCNVF